MSTIDRADRLIGSTLGPYTLHECIGRGGSARVYRATQASLGRDVALKVIAPTFDDDPTFLARFQREAALAAGLVHPNIVPVFDYGEDAGRFYIAMTMISGGTLRDWIRHGDLTTTIQLVARIADALEYAHGRGLIHRDVKPSNILLTEDGWPLLADFGIARMTEDEESRLTRTGLTVGTPEYVSPEQGEGERSLDGRSDMYSLGIVLYELATGRVPFHATSAYATIRQHLTEAPDLSVAPASIVPVLKKALAKRPENRFASAAEFRDALLAVSPDASTGPASSQGLDVVTSTVLSTAEGVTRIEAVRRKQRRGIALAAIFGLIAGGAGVWSIVATEPPRSSVVAGIIIETVTPTATPEPTVVPTASPTVPPTMTPEPEPEPAGASMNIAAVEPTNTAMPTNTRAPLPPTATPVPPTETPEPPTSTPTMFPTPTFFGPTNTPAPSPPPNQGGGDDGGSSSGPRR